MMPLIRARKNLEASPFFLEHHCYRPIIRVLWQTKTGVTSKRQRKKRQTNFPTQSPTHNNNEQSVSRTASPIPSLGAFARRIVEQSQILVIAIAKRRKVIASAVLRRRQSHAQRNRAQDLQVHLVSRVKEPKHRLRNGRYDISNDATFSCHRGKGTHFSKVGHGTLRWPEVSVIGIGLVSALECLLQVGLAVVQHFLTDTEIASVRLGRSPRDASLFRGGESAHTKRSVQPLNSTTKRAVRRNSHAERTRKISLMPQMRTGRASGPRRD